MAHSYGTKARLPATATTTTANPATFTINCPAGTTVLWLGIIVSGTTARSGGNPTYNGVSMVAGNAKANAGGTAEENSETWYLLDPPTGSAYTISVPNAGSLAMTLIAASASAASGYKSYRGTGVSTPGNSTNPSTSVTTTKNGAAIFAVIGNGATTWSPTGRSGTQLYDWDAGSRGMGAQYFMQASAGSQTISWTFGTSEDWIIQADAFYEYPTQAVDGSLPAASGGLTNFPQITRGGSLDLSGTLARFTQTARTAGILAVLGELVPVYIPNVIQQAVGGVLDLTGTLVRQTSKAIAGALTSAGQVAKGLFADLDGAFTFAGGIEDITVGKLLFGVLWTNATIDPLGPDKNVSQSLAAKIAILFRFSQMF